VGTGETRPSAERSSAFFAVDCSPPTGG